MYMRLLQSRIKPGVVDRFREFYETRVIPELQKMPGQIEQSAQGTAKAKELLDDRANSFSL